MNWKETIVLLGPATGGAGFLLWVIARYILPELRRSRNSAGGTVPVSVGQDMRAGFQNREFWEHRFDRIDGKLLELQTRAQEGRSLMADEVRNIRELLQQVHTEILIAADRRAHSAKAARD